MQVSTKMYVVTVVIETWETEKKKHTPEGVWFSVGLAEDLGDPPPDLLARGQHPAVSRGSES